MKTLTDLEAELAVLEDAAAKNGAAQLRAIGCMKSAIRDHGVDSAQAKSFEDEADAAFDAGEKLVLRLQRLTDRIERLRAAQASAVGQRTPTPSSSPSAFVTA